MGASDVPVAQLDRASASGAEGTNPPRHGESQVTEIHTRPESAPHSAQVSKPANIDPPADPDLTRIIGAWPTLPAAVKAGILAMVGATAGTQEAKQ